MERVNGATGEVDGDQEAMLAALEQGDLAEAVRALRELLATCRPYERSGVATGHRVEGAVVALTTLAGASSNDRL